MDYRIVVQLSPQHGHKNRGALWHDGAARGQVVHPDLVGRAIFDKGIARVETGVVEQEKRAAVQGIGPGFSEYVDSAKPDPIVLSGKRVLIYEDLSNSLFCRESLAGGETV